MPAKPPLSIHHSPNHYLMHGSGKLGLASLSNLDVCRYQSGRVQLAALISIMLEMWHQTLELYSSTVPQWLRLE
jgi:hypothetical protein